MAIIILFAMLFMHIVDDYYLQGCLAKYKQQFWWKENVPDDIYRRDWLVALIEHAFSWSFSITIPIVLLWTHSGEYHPVVYVIFFILNVALHAFIDHLKCNLFKCSLLMDQILHCWQVVFTWIFLCLWWS